MEKKKFNKIKYAVSKNPSMNSFVQGVIQCEDLALKNFYNSDFRTCEAMRKFVVAIHDNPYIPYFKKEKLEFTEQENWITTVFPIYNYAIQNFYTGKKLVAKKKLINSTPDHYDEFMVRRKFVLFLKNAIKKEYKQLKADPANIAQKNNEVNTPIIYNSIALIACMYINQLKPIENCYDFHLLCSNEVKLLKKIYKGNSLLLSPDYKKKKIQLHKDICNLIDLSLKYVL